MDDTTSNLVALLMRDRHLSARGLSLKAGLKNTAVRDILNGKSKQPKTQTLAKLASALDVPLIDLIPKDQREVFINQYRETADYVIRKSAAQHAHRGNAPLAGEIGSGDITAANFSGSNLSGASFIGARLFGVNFSRADLSFANFTACDLRNANFQDAIFKKTIFVQADLRGANLAGVNLAEAFFVAESDDGRGSPPKTS